MKEEEYFVYRVATSSGDIVVRQFSMSLLEEEMQDLIAERVVWRKPDLCLCRGVLVRCGSGIDDYVAEPRLRQFGNQSNAPDLLVLDGEPTTESLITALKKDDAAMKAAIDQLVQAEKAKRRASFNNSLRQSRRAKARRRGERGFWKRPRRK